MRKGALPHVASYTCPPMSVEGLAAPGGTQAVGDVVFPLLFCDGEGRASVLPLDSIKEGNVEGGRVLGGAPSRGTHIRLPFKVPDVARQDK